MSGIFNTLLARLLQGDLWIVKREGVLNAFFLLNWSVRFLSESKKEGCKDLNEWFNNPQKT